MATGAARSPGSGTSASAASTPLPTENYVEVSVGRDLSRGFGIDLGYQWGRTMREETGTLGTSHAVLVRPGYSGGL